MITFKCKMCGGDLTFEPGASVAECPYCGTNQTLPKLDDDKRANLYDRANHFRRQNEYDKATAIYEQILADERTDAEAYWSLVLCRYGIEYVEDPASHKRVPTVNRVQYASILANEDYKSALQYADTQQRSVYEAEANAIAEIQKGILDISRKEAPFDVFICYKETDANGRRTPDSVLANDMYHQLTKEGFKVFFSRITLEDKIGTAYEPYIFAALNSAKVMVVLGTKPEYFNAVWVKNEWSRYLALIRNGADKTLVPAYRDMDPYDLPEEFAHLQAQDMGKLGFMQDLIRGIKKILHKDEPKPQTAAQPTAAAPTNNVAPLLKRAFMFLEDGDFARADDFCEQVLNLDPENGRAYLGKLMVDLQVRRESDLKNLPQPFDRESNYQKIMRFGDEALKKQVQGDIEYIEKRNEYDRQKHIYDNACQILRNAHSTEQYEAALELFCSISQFNGIQQKVEECKKGIESSKHQSYNQAQALQKEEKWQEAIVLYRSLGDYYDSIARADECEEKILADTYRLAVNYQKEGKWDNAIRRFEQLKNYRDSSIQAQRCRKAKEEERKAEEKRIEQEKQVKQAKEKAEAAKRMKHIVIAVAATVFIIGICLLYTNVIKPNSVYNKGTTALKEGRYDEATVLFEGLRDFKDAAIQAQESQYQKGLALMVPEHYDEATDVLLAMNQLEWNRSENSLCHINKGTMGSKNAEEINAVEEAIDAVEMSFEEASRIEQPSLYREIVELGISGYRDSLEMALKSQFQKGLMLQENGNYDDATKVFVAINGYNDASTQAQESQYRKGVALLTSGDYDDATKVFNAISGYNDAATQAQESQYQKGVALLTSGDYDDATKVFDAISDYNDAATQAQESQYKKGVALLTSGDYDDATKVFDAISDYNDAATQAQESQYRKGLLLLECGSYDDAKQIFDLILEYKDASTQANKCIYQKGQELLEKGELDEAISCFSMIGGYSDAEKQLKECQYHKAFELKTAGDYDAAYQVYALLAGYKDVDNIMESDENIAAAAWRAQFMPGNIVSFGSYEQDNDISNGAEFIEWIVLENDGNSCTLISKYALECRPYNEYRASISWESCTLRKWLNGEFVNVAFTAEERDIIDKEVYLLSIDEVRTLFNDDNARQCQATAYAKAHGAYVANSGSSMWWLRSSGLTDDRAAVVYCNGSMFNPKGYYVDSDTEVVRPVISLRIA